MLTMIGSEMNLPSLRFFGTGRKKEILEFPPQIALGAYLFLLSIGFKV